MPSPHFLYSISFSFLISTLRFLLSIPAFFWRKRVKKERTYCRIDILTFGVIPIGETDDIGMRRRSEGFRPPWIIRNLHTIIYTPSNILFHLSVCLPEDFIWWAAQILQFNFFFFSSFVVKKISVFYAVPNKHTLLSSLYFILLHLKTRKSASFQVMSVADYSEWNKFSGIPYSPKVNTFCRQKFPLTGVQNSCSNSQMVSNREGLHWGEVSSIWFTLTRPQNRLDSFTKFGKDSLFLGFSSWQKKVSIAAASIGSVPSIS